MPLANSVHTATARHTAIHRHTEFRDMRCSCLRNYLFRHPDIMAEVVYPLNGKQESLCNCMGSLHDACLIINSRHSSFALSRHLHADMESSTLSWSHRYLHGFTHSITVLFMLSRSDHADMESPALSRRHRFLHAVIHTDMESFTLS
jgi:hypothetical protein